MGIARLLAKGWIVFCLFAGAHALRFALESGLPPASSLAAIVICVILFMAMGLLFAGGFGVSAGLARTPFKARLGLNHFVPGFNEIIFLFFVAVSFIDQVWFAPLDLAGNVVAPLEQAIYFAVPGQRALVAALDACSLDGGRIFAAAFSWLLAVIYLASACSRLKLQAGIIRLERSTRPEGLGPSIRAFCLGLAAVVGVQFLFVGSAYPWLHCSAFADISGALLVGLAPLMLTYLVVAALATLLASAPEG
ncbi:MAG: hypothetical protein ACREFW_04655 [Rhizomicrobium sp.]